MLNLSTKFTIWLIIRKKLLLLLALILFSMGSYTYSEITTNPISPNKLNGSSIVILKPVSIDFPIYYITPKDFSNVSAIANKHIPLPSEKIMDDGIIESLSLAIFLIDNNPNVEFNYAKNLADLYVSEAIQEGVNPDLAFIQMCHETGFLRFNGTVDRSQNNYCGLGATGNGVKGNTFSDQKEGVRAHIQHLKAYGSTQKLSNKLVDTRFKYVKRGSIDSLSGLTGKWATDVKYDKKIRSLLHRLHTSHIVGSVVSI